MPTSGLVIRLHDPASAARFRERALRLAGLELGAEQRGAIAAAIDAANYELHDALLAALREHEEVCSIDIVFHDFSDVSDFARLPKRQRNSR